MIERASSHPTARLGAWGALAIGVAVWLVLVGLAARGDRTRASFAPPAAPALELSAGAHRIEAAYPGADLAPLEARVFDLATRSPLALTSAGGALNFEVPEAGIYVIDVEPLGPSVVPVLPLEVTVVQTSTFRLSLRLWATLLIAPIASMPGALALAVARPTAAIEDGAAAPFPRRFAAVAIDGLTAALLVVFLVLVSPPFRPLAGLIPVAPVAYAWSTAARGQGVGGWLLLVRTVDLDGRPPGAWLGLLRTLVAGASWGLAGLGYALATLDAEGRTWHDRASGTRVIEA